MIVFRKRLIYWLLKEYIKKWRKIIFLSFFIGLLVFFAFLTIIRYFLPRIPVGKNETIGVVGAYRADSLPDFILEELSSGLTEVDSHGEPKPALASKWKIENKKKYTFYLTRNATFADGSKVTADAIQYNFSNVVVTRPDQYTIIFELKDIYSPFLVTVSRPIFKKGYVGIGPYALRDIKQNGSFIQSLTLSVVKNSYKTKIYQFYPSVEALKIAYMLGEITQAIGLPDETYKTESFADFPNTTVEKIINYHQLITLFYNTQDGILSDKRVRSALSYALPDTFSSGKRSPMPFSPLLWGYAETYTYSQDIDRAKILLSTADIGTKSAALVIEIKTLPAYTQTAKEVVKAWEKIGIHTKVTIVDTLPSNFQVFLGNFFVPKDPDQYTLWHTNQANNITRYENKRIDKLLEDGRTTLDMYERKKIYDDFQKYLTVDAPASFLYFPYEYEITRK